MRLRTTARGTAAGGEFDGQVDSLDGRTEKLDVTLATDNTGRWVGTDERSCAQPPITGLLARNPPRFRAVQRDA